jgi:hypothetical protein
VWAVALLVGALVATTTILAVRREKALLGLWLVLFGVANATAGQSMPIRPHADGKHLFMAVDEISRIVRSNAPERRLLFWFGPSPLAQYFNSIASTHLYLYSLVGTNYPKLPDDASAPSRFSARLESGSRVAVLATTPADDALLRDSFAIHGLSVRVGSVHPIGTGRTAFFLTLLEVASLSEARTH